MKTFDPWPVFFKREFRRNWLSLVGFTITGALITTFITGLTKDAKNSHFVQEHNRGMGNFSYKYPVTWDKIVSFLIRQFSLLWIDQLKCLKFDVDVIGCEGGKVLIWVYWLQS